jgi:hypothetical protein
MEKGLSIPQNAVERARDLFKKKVEDLIKNDPRLRRQFKRFNWRDMDAILFSSFKLPTIYDENGNKINFAEAIKRKGYHMRVIPIYGLAAVLGLKIVEVDGVKKIVPFIHWFDDIPFLAVDPEESTPRQLYIVGGNYKITQHGIEG